MPYIKIQTNVAIPVDIRQRLIAEASDLVSSELGKSEDYVMVVLEASVEMMFGGSNDPLAYVELKSIGLAVDRTDSLSSAICSMLEELVPIEPDRVYIAFEDAKRNMWGWNGGTFA